MNKRRFPNFKKTSSLNSSFLSLVDIFLNFSSIAVNTKSLSVVLKWGVAFETSSCVPQGILKIYCPIVFFYPCQCGWYKDILRYFRCFSVLSFNCWISTTPEVFIVLRITLLRFTNIWSYFKSGVHKGAIAKVVESKLCSLIQYIRGGEYVLYKSGAI